MSRRTNTHGFDLASSTATATQDEPASPAAVLGRAEAEDDGYFDGIPADMEEFREQVVRVAPQETTILLTGETGTGKTRLARLIHSLSRRRDAPFQVVDCGALSPSLIESEMFGHVRGAFTGADRDRAGKFASAGQGTLLLDEINSLPLHLQGKLLRAVEDRVFEPVGANRAVPLQARIIAVTNSRLEEEIEGGRFRSDLYFRLNVVGFFLPPLRSRRTSVAPLCEKFLAEFAARNRPDVAALDPDALSALQEYHWPGNIRELRNVIERAVALCPGPVVQMADLPEAIRRGTRAPAATEPLRSDPTRSENMPTGLPSTDYNGLTLAESKEIAEIRQIKAALAKHNNNRLRAASELGISRMGLYKKLHKYGLVERGGLDRANELAS
jgi:DNA-binding NtrC family response regulator